MKLAVAGGTGQVGATTAEALRGAGYEVVVLARSEGVDLFTDEPPAMPAQLTVSTWARHAAIAAG